MVSSSNPSWLAKPKINMAVVPNSSILIGLLLILPIAIFAPFSMAGSGDNVLYPGETLRATEALTSGNYALVMQANCNLVLYEDTNVLWSTYTGSKDLNCYLTLHNDGNLILYNSQSNSMWSSNSRSRKGDYILVLQKDGNAVIYGDLRWTIGFDRITHNHNSTMPIAEDGGKLIVGESNNLMYPGEILKTDQSLVWRNYRLTMQNDCKLAMYDSNKYAWSYDFSGKGTGCRLEFGTDGQAGIYDSRNNRLWWSGLHWKEGNYILLLRRDRTMSVYGTDRWSTNWDTLTHIPASKSGIAMVTK